MRQLIGAVLAELQVVRPDSEVRMPPHPVVHPSPVPVIGLFGRHEVEPILCMYLLFTSRFVCGRAGSSQFDGHTMYVPNVPAIFVDAAVRRKVSQSSHVEDRHSRPLLLIGEGAAHLRL